MEPNVTDRIREAIGSRDFDTASRLWNDYSAQFRDELTGGIVSPERMAETRELFEWSRNALLCARAQDLDRLNAIHVAGVYARENRL